ncbi:PREDICTED: protein CREG1-like [Rhagoletis zephyria]|uniref:protein CREG1-like n=1 Tax=Rhagoletis zephyria TaxID=28612 RepID=UPI0008112B63|nr:PREDICTED: protein CREG1-like [Rhagoletis zephyria]
MCKLVIASINMSKAIAILTGFLFALISLDSCAGYSAHGRPPRPITDAVLARQLVHQSNWAAVGSISHNEKTADYPMVNVIAVDDSALNGSSTGRVHFLLADFDFTGADALHNNKVTFFFSEEQTGSCNKRGVNPMEPACPRIMISGRVQKLDTKIPEYNDYMEAFNKRHKHSKIWVEAHNFYLSELEIDNIYIVAYQGGPRTINAEDYYNAHL